MALTTSNKHTSLVYNNGQAFEEGKVGAAHLSVTVGEQIIASCGSLTFHG